MVIDPNKLKPLHKFILIKLCRPKDLNLGALLVLTENATFKFEVGQVWAKSDKVREDIKLKDFVSYEKGAENLFYNEEGFALIREIDTYFIFEGFSTEDFNKVYLDNIKSVGGKKI